MKQQAKKLWEALYEKLPYKNYTPEQKQALIKKTALLGALVTALVLLVLLVALFPVTRVEVEQNDSHYTSEEIADALAPRTLTPVLGQLFGRGERMLLDKLLYLEEAQVRYSFPGTLRVSVKEQQPLFYFPYQTELSGKPHAGWMLIGPDLRIVDAGQDSTVYSERGYIKLALPEPALSKTQPGRASSLKFTDEDDEDDTSGKTEEDFAYVREFLGYLGDSSYMDQLTAVDLESKFDVRITVQSQWQIRFGRVKDRAEFERKLALAEQMLAEMDTDAGQKYIVDVGASIPYVRPADDMDLDEIWSSDGQTATD